MERETHPSSRARARAPLRIMTPGNVVRGSLLGVVDGRRKDSVLCAHLQCTLRREIFLRTTVFLGYFVDDWTRLGSEAPARHRQLCTWSSLDRVCT